MPANLYRLIYISQASHDLAENELARLLEQDRSNNLRDEIMGVLALTPQQLDALFKIHLLGPFIGCAA